MVSRAIVTLHGVKEFNIIQMPSPLKLCVIFEALHKKLLDQGNC